MKRNTTTTIIGSGIGLTAFAAIAFGINTAYGNMVFPAERGVNFLEEKGYSQIEGGTRDYFNMCGKDDPARSYTAIHPETGQRVTRTVCYNPLLGPHAPALGMAY